MSIMLRASALAFALLAGTALTAAPAMAGYDRHGGWNNKSWNVKHGYKHGRKHRGYANKHWNKGYGNRGYGYRKRGYGYNRYGWGNKGWFSYGRPHHGSYYRRRPGFSIYID